MKNKFSKHKFKNLFLIVFFVVVFCCFTNLMTEWYLSGLPRVHMAPDYPYLTIRELEERAEYIIYGEVKRMKRENVLSLLWKNTLGTTSNQIQKTPIVIKVKQVLKGDVKEKQVVYYQDGGFWNRSIIYPHGFCFTKGDEVILFLSESKEGWGYYGEFPVVNGQVFGVLDEDLKEFASVRSRNADEVNSAVIQKYVRKNEMSPQEEFRTVDLKEFIKYIK